MNLSNIIIIFVENDKEMFGALQRNFGDLFNVKIFRGNFVQISKSDCLVCPSNSYGLLENGIQKTIKILFEGISDKITKIINNIYYGEQPIGTSFLVNTQNNNYKFIAHVPIIRYNENIKNSNNLYCAFRALLTCILNHNKVNDNKINSILISSFRHENVNPDETARQMRIAYNLIDLGFGCSKENAKFIDDILN